MNIDEAVDAFLEALHPHKWECGCNENGKIRDEKKCTCGATDFNHKLIQALVVLKYNTVNLPTIKFQVRIESPTYKFNV